MAEGVPASWAPAPAASALNALIARVQRYVLAPDDPESGALAQSGIEDAIRKLNRHRWHWARTSQDIDGSGAREYALDAQFKSERSAAMIDPNTLVILRMLSYLPPPDFEEQTAGPLDSLYYYTVFNAKDTGLVTLSFAMQTGESLRIRYFKKIAFAQETEQLDIPSEAETFVEWSAKAYIAAHWALDKYPIAKREADECWMEMIRDNSRQETTD